MPRGGERGKGTITVRYDCWNLLASRYFSFIVNCYRIACKTQPEIFQQKSFPVDYCVARSYGDYMICWVFNAQVWYFFRGYLYCCWWLADSHILTIFNFSECFEFSAVFLCLPSDNICLLNWSKILDWLLGQLRAIDGPSQSLRRLTKPSTIACLYEINCVHFFHKCTCLSVCMSVCMFFFGGGDGVVGSRGRVEKRRATIVVRPPVSRFPVD